MSNASDDDRLREEGEQLARAIEEALPRYLKGRILERLKQAFDELPEDAELRAERAARDGLALIATRLWNLVRADVDEQASTPLSLLRASVDPATALLVEFDVPALARDRFMKERFPSDPYSLYPTKLGELGAVVGERAITWGAAKAYVHRRRHGPS